jgi:gliding motility-associated-like protein
MEVNWIRPDTLDTTSYHPPYELVLNRKPLNSGEYSPLGTYNYSSFAAINDTSYIDTLLDTKGTQYEYQVQFYGILNGNRTMIDKSPLASSLYTTVYSTDNTNILSWTAAIPWINKRFVVYRENENASFDSIGFSTSNLFSDTGLINGKEYCYYVQSQGGYNLLPLFVINNSQRICGTPIDTVKPCPPILVVVPPCSDNPDSFNVFSVKLAWTPRVECAEDVLFYRVYYKHESKDSFQLLATTPNQFVYEYTDNRDVLRKSIAGCYVVVGVDSFFNESPFTNQTCIDNCPKYDVPNIFTPNGDGLNDLLNPFPYRFIDHIKFTVYNRWGGKVYETDDIDLNWNGKKDGSGNELAPGVYFYICDVYEQFLNGLQMRNIRGTIQIIR